jgi:hypothetical protein
MKIAGTALFLISMTIKASGEGGGQSLPAVTVCTEGVADFRTAAQSHGMVSQIFATVGVRIFWRQGLKGCAKESILITLTDKTPLDFHPGAMAYAMPYEGAHIGLFYDRVALAGSPLSVHLLAHVLAHEIAHILQGVDRHSSEGLLKARWTQEDYDLMMRGALPFTGEDVDLIHQGLGVRATRYMAAR